ncbi:unnamed protein product [Staurois parvus]|uniref:Uncharacterized protein n=1 Tax=Staurois parvus TaxID=386267 RepID=A0ABN9AFK3_9NEOB|nr:unnamed protein product [Staurois parvus]
MNYCYTAAQNHISIRDFVFPGRGRTPYQGRTDNSWGLRAIGDHGAAVSLPKFKKAYEMIQGASHLAPY